jgi:hypothetical protein
MAMALLLGATALLPTNRSKADDLAIYFTTTNLDVSEEVVDLIHTNPPDELPYLPNMPPTLHIYSQKNGTDYSGDSRPTNDFSTFNLYLSANLVGSSHPTVEDRLLFYFWNKESNINYLASINIPSNYTSSGGSFVLTTNVTGELVINLPGITNFPNDTIYGTVNVTPFVLPTTNAPPTINSFSANSTTVTIGAAVYSSGTCTPQYSPSVGTPDWTDLTNYSQFINTGTSNLTFSVPITSTNQEFYRFKESIMQ